MDCTINPKLSDTFLAKMKTLCELLQTDSVFESYELKHQIIHKPNEPTWKDFVF